MIIVDLHGMAASTTTFIELRYYEYSARLELSFKCTLNVHLIFASIKRAALHYDSKWVNYFDVLIARNINNEIFIERFNLRNIIKLQVAEKFLFHTPTPCTVHQSELWDARALFELPNELR